jgi:hypothetical protein
VLKVEDWEPNVLGLQLSTSKVESQDHKTIKFFFFF